MYAEVMFAGRCLFVLWQVSLLIVTLSCACWLWLLVKNNSHMLAPPLAHDTIQQYNLVSLQTFTLPAM